MEHYDKYMKYKNKYLLLKKNTIKKNNIMVGGMEEQVPQKLVDRDGNDIPPFILEIDDDMDDDMDEDSENDNDDMEVEENDGRK